MKKIIKKLISFVPGLKTLKITSRRLFFKLLFKSSVFLGAGFDTQSAFLLKDSFKIILWINPEIIKYRAPRNQNKYFVQDINNNEIKTIEESTPTIAPTVEKIFIKKESYESTPQFYEMIEQVNKGQKAYYCKSTEGVHHYFKNLGKTYESMKSNGYLLQKNLKEKDESLIDPRKKDSNDDEIQLVIDENYGLLLGWGGTHRLLIAKILKLNKVAGLVDHVDKEWARNVFYESRSYNLQKAIETRLNNGYFS